MANTNLRETAFCLIGGLRKAQDAIQHCFSITGVGETVTWNSPGLLDENCREVFVALRDCSVAFVKFQKAYEPFQKDVPKHVANYRLDKPKGFLSHLQKLCEQSFVVLRSLSDICNRGGDFQNWYVSNPPWVSSDWWDGLKIQPRPQLDNLLDALQTRVEEYRPMIESITEGDFCESILQEIEAVELELEPQNPPGKENQGTENDTQNTRIKDGLYREQKRFVWDGESYDDLSETMMNVLDVLHKNYPNKTFEKEFENKIGTIQSGGFWKWFRVNRAELQGNHPVKKIVRGRIDTGIYLKSKQ